MAWDHLSITKSHLVYIILGGFTSLFMLCSSVIKERMYIGEATVATLCGLIFGPHAANLIDPQTWGNVDEVTLEFSRIVLVVQCFAVGVELPKFYMEKHWKSVVFLLLPVMTFGWLITSLFIWWMVPTLDWLESLCVAACVTATDPVLASSVVGKGKFAKRVPKHLRDLLSAESGCNDGMAFPFIYLALYLIQEHLDAKQTTYHWLVFTVLYECIFGAIYGFAIGYIARHGIKYAEEHDLVDRESFLVFYFTLALFCAGSGSILGVDDLLVGFAAGVGFSNDGWFSAKTEESHVSNVIDLLINLAYFVFLGTIIPWDQFNNAELGLSAWRLVVIAIFVILFRRIPIMLALKPFIPDIKTWREAAFAGHFGPIGVGAIFVAILARAELETETTIPLAELPPEDTPHYHLIALVWPIVTFLVISSILVHGSSVAVFTLGKHINTLSITMSYTAAPEDGPTWMNRLPRISSQSKSQARSTMSDTDVDDEKTVQLPPGALLPTGMPGQFLRRQKEEEDNPSRAASRASSRRRSKNRKRWDDGIGPGGPVTQSAIFPQRRTASGALETMSPTSPMSPSMSGADLPRQDTSGTLAVAEDENSSTQLREKESESSSSSGKGYERSRTGDHEQHNTGPEGDPGVEIYDEGDNIIIEDQDGQVLAVEPSKTHHKTGEVVHDMDELKEQAKQETSKPGWTYDGLKKQLGKWKDDEVQKRKGKTSHERRHEPARAYQFGNTIIVEDEDGEVVKKYELPSQKPEGQGSNLVGQSLKIMGMGGKKQGQKLNDEAVVSEAGPSEDRPKALGRQSTFSGWTGFNKGGASEGKKKNAAAEELEKYQAEDDRKIRFTIGGQGRRMTKEDFLSEVRKMDAKTKRQVLENSDAPDAVLAQAKRQPVPAVTISAPGSGAATPSSTGGGIKVTAAKNAGSSSSRGNSNSPARPEPARGRSSTAREQQSVTELPIESHPDAPSNDEPETAVERRRRLAALSGMRDDAGEPHREQETPAERRRREAALGVGSGEQSDSDSEDDNTPRVPPTRRGIRFADAPAKGRK
ncbi:alkali metal cation/H+ antiporter Nha1 C terminus-domain-containing protein [Truncatella angustata]|uniref:Alkali metal cation/H+ antiporter Nha1 C terminus-domain-containing protein n=1 Tax=Truncatella angustata TaxID=152316 RepID=A0A9P9A199_9PEZI|nr:alkali metal cation/H+ antiporter Nha1 C terminus-domain-containing protein [Truncatella angustata]KAH6658113.1 alkali metal cation/H+ antiporter Nha1 C terminus-domain-containing protein [Truncatella angustata]